jgi:hypothetical protein
MQLAAGSSKQRQLSAISKQQKAKSSKQQLAVYRRLVKNHIIPWFPSIQFNSGNSQAVKNKSKKISIKE